MSEDQRFVKQGVPVWDPAARRAAAPQKSVSAKEKRAAMERDDFMCTVCGISGGEPYPEDSTQFAVLSVTRLETVLPDGQEKILLTTECKRCRSGSSGAPADAAEVLMAVRALEPSDQQRLARWINRGRRVSTPVERAWSAYRRLPAEARSEIRSVVAD
jgi:hypothetical protein